jgi:hypothetical protein
VLRYSPKEQAMTDNQQGVVLDEKNQEQPADKDRAQTAHKTNRGHMPQQPVERKD